MSVEFFEGLNVIREGAFFGCKSLKTVEIPKSVIEIADNAFLGCRMLEKAIFLSKDTVKVTHKAFEGCNKLVLRQFHLKNDITPDSLIVLDK